MIVGSYTRATEGPVNRSLGRLLVVVIALGTFCTHRSLACSCGSLTNIAGTCRDLKATGPSFVGTVIDIENPPDERRGVNHGGVSRYRFRVDENISGFEQKEVDVYSGRGGGDCSYHFRSGQSYFVTPYKAELKDVYGVEPGKFVAVICTETQTAETARALLAELRARKQGATVEGILRTKEQPNDYNHEMPDVLVELWGERTTFSAQTEKSGLFRFHGIPAGTYRFAAELPPNFQLVDEPPGDSPPSITITDRLCYAKDIYALPTAHVAP
jgi:hypothetical protein